MYWHLDEDQRFLVEAARDYARAELIAKDRVWDATEQSLADELPALAEMGFMNMRVREEYGGLGCSMSVYSRILHELAYASPSVSDRKSVV